MSALNEIAGPGSLPTFIKIPSNPDGHCFLHSFASSYTNQICRGMMPLFKLKCLIIKEVVNNLDTYTPFINLDNVSLLKQLHLYIFKKIYNTDFGDLVPLVTANAIEVNITILNCDITLPNETACTEIIARENGNSLGKCVYLMKSGEHYDGLSIKSVSDFSNIASFMNVTKTVLRSSNFIDYINILCYVPDTQGPVKSCLNSSNAVLARESNSSDDYDNVFIKALLNFRRTHLKNLIVAHLNVNSLRHKFPEISDMLSQNTCDLLFLSETKLDESFSNSLFSVPNFSKPIRADRNCNLEVSWY